MDSCPGIDRRSSGRVWESQLFDVERDRSERGVRGPLDWYYNARFYVSVVLGILIGVGAGLQLLVAGPGWLHLVGPVVLGPSLWLAWHTVRWLLRPVDGEALAGLRRQQEARRSGGLRKRRPPRFPPGSRNSTRLPSKPEQQDGSSR
jgi:hypothetical protein